MKNKHVAMFVFKTNIYFKISHKIVRLALQSQVKPTKQNLKIFIGFRRQQKIYCVNLIKKMKGTV
ncbi:hypothetical protein [Mycoplasmopsis bovirhinis]|uniref:hypothetical protein n=1 Tax=Mycoplasmopsis bovirhinis TaxID=29553 RepID=UPI000E754F88|nr:hypothetical protein [Mycoplasmopsis bovirhinis]